uniref:Uncharacterized protein n=1 Tax=Anguilla anguilla TaxID=7936 RepID=A0A0E9PU22_ANGAN
MINWQISYLLFSNSGMQALACDTSA